MSEKKLPEIIFVERRSNDSEEWLELVESVEELAKIGEIIAVGVYRLVEVRKVKGTVEIIK